MSRQLMTAEQMDAILRGCAEDRPVLNISLTTGLPAQVIRDFLINLGRGLTLQTITLPDPEPSDYIKDQVRQGFSVLKQQAISQLSGIFQLDFEQIKAILAEKEVR